MQEISNKEKQKEKKMYINTQMSPDFSSIEIPEIAAVTQR
jgi:hypothetical protein